MNSLKSSDIKFNNKDIYSPDINRYAINIVNHIKHESELCEYLCDIVLKFTSKHKFMNEFDEYTKNFESLNKTLGLEIDDFISSIRDAYLKFDNEEDIDKLRGRIFEVLIESIYSTQYGKPGEKFGAGCEIVIKGKQIHYIDDNDSSKNRKTVDIAGYSKNKSEFYELKVGPIGFNESVVKFLINLKDKCDFHNVSLERYIGCMTMKSSPHLQMQLRKMESEFSLDTSSLVKLTKKEVIELVNKRWRR